jgi:hypothetical protein
VNGAEFTVSITLAVGAADSGNGTATGASLIVTASIQGGEASFVIAGFDLTVTASIEGGVVADNSSAGFDLTVTASIDAGSADGGNEADYYLDWVIQTYGFEADIYPSWWAS